MVDDRLKTEPNHKHNKWLKGRLKSWFELYEGALDFETKVKKLEGLVVSMKRYLEKMAPHRWLFVERHDRIPVPYFVDSIIFQKRRKSRDVLFPAYVQLRMHAYSHGRKTSDTVSWYETGWKPKTVPQLLADKGLSVETPAAVTAYQKDLEQYGKYQNACGLQVQAIGDAVVAGKSYWGGRAWSVIPMVRNGSPSKIVLDPNTEELEGNKGDDESQAYTVTLWDEVPDRNGLTSVAEEAEVEDEDSCEDSVEKHLDVMLPLHPHVYGFDIDHHQWVDIHVQNLSDYPWDKTLMNKLILPKDQKGILEILMSTIGHNVSDIVRGKMSGVIVLATGVPGIGKTLTAEVFSEHIEKPLYTVQCSQLGLSVDTIESNLQEVLNRAARWGAVLLIDEADVYIRRRGEDITQNAIVGVFLRLLEYYRGVLFMTSNRGNIIDDAILSRATAWVQYRLPDAELLKEIWRVLSAQYKVKLAPHDISGLVKALPNLSGRSVRNILKLATLLKGTKATPADICEVSQYQALEEPDIQK